MSKVKSFGQAFLKACAGGGREALLALPQRAKLFPAAFLFVSFFSVPLAVKEKAENAWAIFHVENISYL